MNAANDLKAQLYAVAAGDGTDMLNVTPADLDAKDGKIFVKSDPTKFVTHAQVMRVVGGAIIGWGKHPGGNLRKPVGTFEVGSPTVHKSGCASAAEVAVDPGTGQVEILNYVSVLDAGRVIDPITAKGQILAGMPLQVNQALYFDDIYDPVTGRLLNFNHIGDKMGTTLDVPVDVDKTDDSCLLETIDAVGPFGSHGIGEPAVSSFVSINNAVNNAIGVDIITGPMTPQKVLQALGKA
jgi:CO/xanthine dehydrogenase Mo-binding subunit